MLRIIDPDLSREPGARQIDPYAPVEKQAAVLVQLIKNPPENLRRVRITPDLAQCILRNLNPLDRPRSSSALTRYACDMAAGNWALTGDTIKFGRTGVLHDGQRRLAACVRSGCAFDTYVAFGIDDHAFSVIDRRMKRTGNAFAIAGIPNPSATAGAVRWLLSLTSGDAGEAATFDNWQLLAEYRKLETDKFDACVTEAIAVHRHIQSLPASSLAALIFLFRRKAVRATATFLADLQASRGPARKMVNRIDELRMANGGRIHENVRNALIILTWQAYVAGRGLRKADLTWDATKEFPEI